MTDYNWAKHYLGAAQAAFRLYGGDDREQWAWWYLLLWAAEDNK